ncbi:hypothetical protein MIR68_010465 [Amoeboaphelidium protococcarum]|nr:hypothetical protein MIR68_010465 [Amoeboaphelidium protococcarum]
MQDTEPLLGGQQCKQKNPIDLTFRDINLTIPVKVKAKDVAPDNKFLKDVEQNGGGVSESFDTGFIARMKQNKKVKIDKQILSNVSGRFRHSRLVAVMGPSGSGKTSLLNVLADEINVSGAKTGGHVLINGQKTSSGDLRKLAGYVYQNDLMMETQTVREAVLMSAQLRLPESVGIGEKERIVDDVLSMLNLTHTANTKIKNISGGESKRTALAMELVINPQVLFIDEPTSGLDSFTAFNVVEQLKLLAKDRTIITTIHQPNSDIFMLFDDLFLLEEGRVVYDGPVNKVVDYFENLGYTCPKYVNPADFIFMQVLNDKRQYDDKLPQFKTVGERKQFLLDSWKKHVKSQSSQSQGRTKEMRFNSIGSRVDDDGDYDSSAQSSDTLAEAVKGNKFATSFFTQFKFLFKRAFLNVMRNPLLFNVKLVQVLFISLLLGSIYWRIDTRTLDQQLQNRPGALFFIVANMIMMYAFGILTIFSNEKLVFYREFSNRYYSLPAYFLSKILVDLPFQIFFPLLQAVLMYFTVFWDCADVQRFFIFALTLIILANVGQTIGIFAACAFNDINVALAIVPIILMPAMTFAGLFVNTSSVPVYFIWIEYLSPMKYGFHALMKNEYIGWKYQDEAGNTLITGEQALSKLGLDDARTVDLDLLILTGLLVALLIFAYIGLYRAVKVRR